MVNWYKVAGIVLIVLGIFFLLGGMVVVSAREVVHSPPLWIPAMGIVMIVVGVYLYYLGSKRQKKGV